MARTQGAVVEEDDASVVLPDEAGRHTALDDLGEDRRHQTLGSHWKNRMATTTPPMPHAASTSRSLVWRPLPLTWKKEPMRASAKWRTGKSLPRVSSHCGGFWSGMKTFEMNSSGRIVPLTMAGEASALGTTAVRATPRTQNTAAPTTRVNANAGSVAVGSVAP